MEGIQNIFATGLPGGWTTAVILLFIAVLPVLIWVIQHGRGERRVRRLLSRFGRKTLDKVSLPDGMDGELTIDHLVLTSSGILVLSVKRYDGFIYAGEKIEMWTQVLKGKNFPFANPLKELNLSVLAVKAVAQDVPVTGKVLFAGRGEFPNDKPPGVITLDDIPAKAVAEKIPETWVTVWKALEDMQKNKLTETGSH